MEDISAAKILIKSSLVSLHIKNKQGLLIENLIRTSGNEELINGLFHRSHYKQKAKLLFEI